MGTFSVKSRFVHFHAPRLKHLTIHRSIHPSTTPLFTQWNSPSVIDLEMKGSPPSSCQIHTCVCGIFYYTFYTYINTNASQPLGSKQTKPLSALLYCVGKWQFSVVACCEIIWNQRRRVYFLRGRFVLWNIMEW